MMNKEEISEKDRHLPDVFVDMMRRGKGFFGLMVFVYMIGLFYVLKYMDN